MTDYSYQLYSSRNFQPLDKTLEMLASLGYRHVEGYAGLVDSASTNSATELRSLLDQYGFTMPTCHIGIEQLEDNPAQNIELATTLGVKTVFVPAIAEEQRTTNLEDWKSLANRLQLISKLYSKEDISIGWHNHDFEFNKTDNGELPLDVLMEHAPDIELELDVAWAVVGKSDPLALIDKYEKRIVAAHIKDIAASGECSDEDGWADVGHGTMDWKLLHAELHKRGVQHFVMEHDNPSDHQRFAARSIQYCRSLQ